MSRNDCVLVGRDFTPGNQYSVAIGSNVIHGNQTIIGGGIVGNMNGRTYNGLYHQVPINPFLLRARELFGVLELLAPYPTPNNVFRLITTPHKKCAMWAHNHKYVDKILTMHRLDVYKVLYTMDNVQQVVHNPANNGLYGYSDAYTEDDCAVLEAAVALFSIITTIVPE